MEIRPTYPIFLEDVTVNRHIFFLALDGPAIREPNLEIYD
jgi:hypothetical protein